MRYAPTLLLPLFFVLLLCGCQTSQRWGVPTTVEIANLAKPSKEVYPKIKRALAVAPEAITQVKVVKEDPLTIQIDDLDTYADVEAARAIIERVLSRDYEPTRLASAQLVFQSVTGTAEASIQATGQATPGAEVYVDAGNDEPVKAEVGANGAWALSVKPNPLLLKRDGEIYALIIKEQTYELICLNVFKPAGSQRISQSALPEDSALRPLIKKMPGRTIQPSEPDHSR